MWLMLIGYEISTSANGRNHHLMIMLLRLTMTDIGRQHKTRHARIWHNMCGSGTQHWQWNVATTKAYKDQLWWYASTRWYLHCLTLGSIIHGLCALGKWSCATACSIKQGLNAINVASDVSMFTLASAKDKHHNKRHVWFRKSLSAYGK